MSSGRELRSSATLFKFTLSETIHPILRKEPADRIKATAGPSARVARSAACLPDGSRSIVAATVAPPPEPGDRKDRVLPAPSRLRHAGDPDRSDRGCAASPAADRRGTTRADRSARRRRRTETTAQRPDRAAGRARSSEEPDHGDRKSTRLNSSHSSISYAVFCLKKKNHHKITTFTNYIAHYVNPG